MSSGETTLLKASAPAASRSSFYTAMRILPREQRDAMYSVYEFCRAVDDVADGDGGRQTKLDELEKFRSDIDRLYDNGGVTPRTAQLAVPVAVYGLLKSDFYDVIDGMVMDVVRDVRSPEWSELDLYCDRVASAVGRLSVRIFGIEEEKGLELSHHLGRALQLTNILRDIDDDAAMGRLYLPKEALRESGIDSADVSAILADPGLDRACRSIAERARQHFTRAHDVMALCPRHTTVSPRLMGSVYGAILDKLIARGWTAPRQGVRHSKRNLIWSVVRDGFF